MIISRTPLRMSFIGGGSDFKDYYKFRKGIVLSTTINKYLSTIVNERFIDNIRVGYSQTEEVKCVEDIKHDLVRESLRLIDGDWKGIDISYTSDILPAHEGSGLGASSAITVGLLNALYAYMGKHASAKTLAKKACEIEIDILKHPIGKQDQYSIAYGGFNYIQFNSDESVYVDKVVMKKETRKELENNLILFYTNINTRSDTILTEQKDKTKNNLKTLDYMVGLTKELLQELKQNNISRFGEILHENWILKKTLASKITNNKIENWYNQARDAGDIGGKILGSGGGGFLLFYCEKPKQDDVRQALLNLRELSFKFEPQGSKIIYISD